MGRLNSQGVIVTHLLGLVRLGTRSRVCEACTLRFNPSRKQSSYRFADSAACPAAMHSTLPGACGLLTVLMGFKVQRWWVGFLVNDPVMWFTRTCFYLS